MKIRKKLRKTIFRTFPKYYCGFSTLITWEKLIKKLALHVCIATSQKNRPSVRKLALSRRLTRSQLIKPSFEGLKKIEILSQLLGRDVRLCPTCKDGKFNTVEMIPKQFPP